MEVVHRSCLLSRCCLSMHACSEQRDTTMCVRAACQSAAFYTGLCVFDVAVPLFTAVCAGEVAMFGLCAVTAACAAAGAYAAAQAGFGNQLPGCGGPCDDLWFVFMPFDTRCSVTCEVIIG